MHGFTDDSEYYVVPQGEYTSTWNTVKLLMNDLMVDFQSAGNPLFATVEMTNEEGVVPATRVSLDALDVSIGAFVSAYSSDIWYL